MGHQAEHSRRLQTLIENVSADIRGLPECLFDQGQTSVERLRGKCIPGPVFLGRLQGATLNPLFDVGNDRFENLVRNQIFQQAGLSVLSQANSAPSAALALLG